jgi:putative ABC transport system ATP-binding protein
MGEALGIEFRGVRKTYRSGDQDLAVLAGIDLKVSPAEFVALMGPSGSGKSTLLNLAAGLDRPNAGTVTVGNSNVSQMPQGAVGRWRSHHVGFIFQRYHLLDALTAAQNVEVPLLLFKLSGAERKRRVKTALDLVGLSERRGHYPRQLSGGQEQRVAIARAIVTDPSVVLADEPTGDLDAQSARDILQLLELLHEKLKKTVLMVTHDPNAAKSANRTVRLEKGLLSAYSRRVASGRSRSAEISGKMDPRSPMAAAAASPPSITRGENRAEKTYDEAELALVLRAMSNWAPEAMKLSPKPSRPPSAASAAPCSSTISATRPLPKPNASNVPSSRVRCKNAV